LDLSRVMKIHHLGCCISTDDLLNLYSNSINSLIFNDNILNRFFNMRQLLKLSSTLIVSVASMVLMNHDNQGLILSMSTK
jgi:hypothetical protein